MNDRPGSAPALEGVDTAFDEAADAFAAVLTDPAVTGSWTSPSVLEGYTIGGLAAHVVAAIAWLVPLMDAAEPSGPASLDRWNYYLDMRVTPGLPVPSTQQSLVTAAERAAQRGSEAVSTKFASALEQCRERLHGAELTRVVDLRPALDHTMRLDAFLATRVVELVVHGSDLAASASLPAPAAGDAAITVVLDTLVGTARRRHGDVEVVRALARHDRAAEAVFPVL